MRTTNKAFISCAGVAGVMLAASGVLAQTPPNPPPMSCPAGAFTVTASVPSVVACGQSTTGKCTEIGYTVSGTANDFANTDHVGALEGLGVAYVKSGGALCSPSPCQIFPVGQGDNLTGLGKSAAHEQAVRVNPNDTKSTAFVIGVVGERATSATTVVVKKGKAVSSCRIIGVGGDAPPAADVAPVTEIVKEAGSECAAEFTLDRITGNVLHVELTGDSPGDCILTQTPVENLKLLVTGTLTSASGNINCTALDPCPLGNAKFGTGYVHSGQESCTTRIIGGRVYTWGASCPE